MSTSAGELITPRINGNYVTWRLPRQAVVSSVFTGLGFAVTSSAHAERFDGGVYVATGSGYLVCVCVSFYLEFIVMKEQ